MRRRPLVWSLVAVLLIAIVSVGATIATGTRPLLGLDLKGGVSVVERPEGAVNPIILQQSVTIIQNRVDGLGVSNSDVARQGNDIVINLPGIKNSQRALATLGQTAELYFRPVYCELPGYTPAPKTASSTTVPKAGSGTKAPTSTSPPKLTPSKVTPSTVKTGAGPLVRLGDRSAELAASDQPLAAGSTTPAGASGTPSSAGGAPSTPPSGATPGASAAAGSAASKNQQLIQQVCTSAASTNIPTTAVSDDTKAATVILPQFGSPAVRYFLGPAEMTGSIVKKATAAVNQQTNEWEVDLTFTSKGSALFDKYAAQHYQCYLQNKTSPPPCAQQAIDLDGQVYSAPNIEAASFNGRASISNQSNPMTQAQAADLANALTYGSLPVRFVPQSVQTVSASIGQDSLRAGLFAGLVAIVLVLLYLIVYYRALGLVVILGLSTSAALLYSIITLLSQTEGLTLTLSGVIGIVVSIGVTADSYVVYFERLKEEVRSGRTVRQSVDRGFSRAYRTIITADASSFMAALILYWLTVGSVRGFAFFLGLSTLLDVFTAYFFTRPLVVLLGRRRAFTEARFLGVARGLGARSIAS